MNILSGGFTLGLGVRVWCSFSSMLSIFVLRIRYLVRFVVGMIRVFMGSFSRESVCITGLEAGMLKIYWIEDNEGL